MSIWESLPLEKNATVVNGFSFKSGDFNGANDVQSIKITNVGVQEFIEETNSFLPLEFSEKYASYLASAGDIVIALTRTLISSGLKVAIVPAQFDCALINQRVAAIKTDASRLDKTFLYYYLTSQSAYDYVKDSVNELMQPNLSIKDLKSFTVPCPPIPEQKRIVAILDQAFADIDKARANAEQNLKNARELFDSYLQQVFSQRGEGWVELSLKEASIDFGRGKSKHRPRNDESLYGGDYPFIQTGEVRNCNHVINSYSISYNEKGLAQSKLWPKGTICITIAANIAETGILDFDGCFPDSIIGVVVDPKVARVSYVEFLLQSFRIILQAKGKGSAQDNINLGTFENMKFPFPAIETQDEITVLLGQLVANIQSLEEIYLAKLDSLDELKKTILQKAFSGELSKNTGVAA